MLSTTQQWKKIGKLKKGTRFLYNDVEFVITKSGFGTGKYVSVQFEKTVGHTGGPYNLPKTSDVQAIIK